jgi:cbb3-type cytochrome oxidase subunit 1
VVALVASLAAAGWIQGHALNEVTIVDGKPVVATFAEIAARTQTVLMIAAAAKGVLLLGTLIFAVNFARTTCSRTAVSPVTDLLRTPSTMEAPAL